MKTKQVAVDYGDRSLQIEVPDSALVVEFQDPAFLPDAMTAVRQALAKPHGSPPLRDIVRPGMRVAIGFDDPTRPALPAQTIIPVLIEELLGAGVSEEDIMLICAPGNHRKYTRMELAAYLGEDVFGRFWPRGQIVNHDCSDPAELKFLGITKHGGYVECNRRFAEADLMLYMGNVSATAWGGYTGMGAVVGLASTRSMASHHGHHVIAQPSSWSAEHRHQPAPQAARGHGHMSFRGLKGEINAHIEQATGKRIFYVNAVGGTKGRIAGVFAGCAPEVDAPAIELADTFNRYPVPQADVLVLGLPQALAYGSSNNQLIAAVGALVPPRHYLTRPVLREGGVVIALCPSAGHIDARTFPSYQEVIDLYGQYHDAAALAAHEEEIGNRPDYLYRYTHGYGYPPVHPFWLFYENEYTLSTAAKVIMAGTTNPGAFRALGITPARHFDDAWRMARKVVGNHPATVIAPTFWSKRVFKFDVQA